MDRYKEYQEYMKKITDTFVSSLTYNSAQPIEEQNTPNYKRVGGNIVFEYTVDENYHYSYLMDKCPSAMDGVIKTPKDVVEAWRKIQNVGASPQEKLFADRAGSRNRLFSNRVDF